MRHDYFRILGYAAHLRRVNISSVAVRGSRTSGLKPSMSFQ